MDVAITINFFGRTEEAVEFYCDAIDAKCVHLTRFGDLPEGYNYDPRLSGKIFHATLRVGSTQIMVSDMGYDHDTTPEKKSSFDRFALMLRVEDIEAADRIFTALQANGSVKVPMTETIFAKRYGIVTDRFGISWKVMVEKEPALNTSSV